MYKRRALLAFPILLSCACAAHADDSGRFTVLEENDYFAPDNLDRHYTQGLQLDYLTPDVQPGGFAAPMDWVHSALPFMFPDDGTASRKIDYFAGQELFTPQDKRIDPPDPRDRPYAGWLEGGASYLQDTNDQILDRFEIQIGLVGPGAKGEQTQNRFHLNIGETTSLGWGYQLRNEPTLNFYGDRHWRFDLLPADGAISADAIPTVGLAAGNAFIYGDVGGMVRLGHNLHIDYGPNRIGPGPTGTAYFNNDKYQGWPIGWYVFAGVEGRAVGHNIFLQGNDFTESRSVEERPLVGDMEGGFAVTFSNFARLSYTYLYRSDEFYGQHNGDHFGSIMLSTYFPF